MSVKPKNPASVVYDKNARWKEIGEGVIALATYERIAAVTTTTRIVLFVERDRRDPQASRDVARLLTCPSVEEAKRLGRRWCEQGLLPPSAERPGPDGWPKHRGERR